MKKKFFILSLGLVALCATVTFKANPDLRGDSQSSLSLANIEALAKAETGNTGFCWNMYSSCIFWNCNNILRCHTCDWVKSDSQQHPLLCQ